MTATLYDSPNLLECETCGESFSALDSHNECRACAAERAEAERQDRLASDLWDAEADRDGAYEELREIDREVASLARELANLKRQRAAKAEDWDAAVRKVAELKRALGE